jgi:DNA invertase Pin-like site-specific DNA recombinase
MKSFVLYRRVSTNRQGVSGLGLESQHETVHRYVTGQKGKVVGEFVEVESGKNNDRPQLTLALSECRRLKATLVVAKLDRLSRNAEFLLRLQNGNVDFVCCDCPNVDRFTVGILALVAQRERELISERTRSALQMPRNVVSVLEPVTPSVRSSSWSKGIVGRRWSSSPRFVPSSMKSNQRG